MTNDLISRSALIEKLKEELDFQCDFFSKKESKLIDGGLRIAVEIIEEAPAVDAVPVVRCKDCKHWNCYGGENHNKGDCSELFGMWCGLNGDDFCSCGERKDNETD